MNYIYRYNSFLGKITLASEGESLTGLWFDNQKYFADTLKGDCKEKNLEIFQQAALWLDIYFRGEKPDFTPKIKLKSSPFREMVWKILLTIPYGQTITYKQIADSIASQRKIKTMSSQAVGGAVSHNPVSIIVPCHRVIGNDGSLTGYAGGLDRKQKLLCLESAL